MSHFVTNQSLPRSPPQFQSCAHRTQGTLHSPMPAYYTALLRLHVNSQRTSTGQAVRAEYRALKPSTCSLPPSSSSSATQKLFEPHTFGLLWPLMMDSVLSTKPAAWVKGWGGAKTLYLEPQGWFPWQPGSLGLSRNLQLPASSTHKTSLHTF